MKEVIVFGIGNRIMTDDGIGIYVVEELSLRNTNPTVRYVVGETDVDYCLDQIKEAAYVIVVDAAFLGKKPGTVSTIPLHYASGKVSRSISVHESNFLNEIKLLGKNIEGLFIGIEPYEIDYGINLSPLLKERFPKIVSHIAKIINA